MNITHSHDCGLQNQTSHNCGLQNQTSHDCGFAVPQINTVPSIPWDELQAPCAATPTDRYQGHLPGSGVQKHSADDAYAQHGIVLEAHEANGRRLWLAKKGERVIAAHPRHDAARFMALALLTGA